jgi:hypothetical protein
VNSGCYELPARIGNFRRQEEMRLFFGHVFGNKRVVMMCSTAHFELARLCYHKDDCSSRRKISLYEHAGGQIPESS